MKQSFNMPPPSKVEDKSDAGSVDSAYHSPTPPGSTRVLVGDKDDDSVDEDLGCRASICAPETRPAFVILKLFWCIVAGIVFGWCMEKSRVSEPASIRLQMVFRRWVMIKMFIGAIAAGQVVMALMSVIPWCKDKFQVALTAFGGCLSDKGILTSVLGPFILGMGMTLAGSCPGMVLPQVGAWAKNSIYTFIGVLIGALLYGLVAPFIVRITRPNNPFKRHTLHEIAKVPYIALALPFGVILGVGVVLMEVYIPYQEDLDCWNRNSIATPWSTNVFTKKSWYPGVAGAIVGAMQVLIVLAADDTLGGSSSYVTFMSQWVVGKKLQKVFPYLAKARCGLGNWWQVFYVVAAVGGGAFSALSSQSIATTQGVSVVSAIFGGILLLLGARLAAGCTSGHGLSGMGLLYWMSFLAVPAMFGGAIVLGYAMDATGALYDFYCYQDCLPMYNTPTWNCTNFVL